MSRRAPVLAVLVLALAAAVSLYSERHGSRSIDGTTVSRAEDAPARGGDTPVLGEQLKRTESSRSGGTGREIGDLANPLRPESKAAVPESLDTSDERCSADVYLLGASPNAWFETTWIVLERSGFAGRQRLKRGRGRPGEQHLRFFGVQGQHQLFNGNTGEVYPVLVNCEHSEEIRIERAPLVPLDVFPLDSGGYSVADKIVLGVRRTDVGKMVYPATTPSHNGRRLQLVPGTYEVSARIDGRTVGREMVEHTVAGGSLVVDVSLPSTAVLVLMYDRAAIAAAEEATLPKERIGEAIATSGGASVVALDDLFDPGHAVQADERPLVPTGIRITLEAPALVSLAGLRQLPGLSYLGEQVELDAGETRLLSNTGDQPVTRK